jgi:hypothetical protein
MALSSTKGRVLSTHKRVGADSLESFAVVLRELYSKVIEKVVDVKLPSPLCVNFAVC